MRRLARLGVDTARPGHVIDGALDLLRVDVDADRCSLEEPNVWYRYTVQT